MAHHEIVEIQDELNPGGLYKTDSYMKYDLKRDEKIRSRGTNSRHISSLEEDLNQLFEVFTRRASSSSQVHPTQASSSNKSASKRPVIPRGSHSPKNGNLKQALRGLCLSQASEMASMKRAIKTPSSSKARTITTLYRNVVVEDEHCLDEGKAFDSSRNSLGHVSRSDSWTSSRSSLVERETGFTHIDNESLLESKTTIGNGKTSSELSSRRVLDPKENSSFLVGPSNETKDEFFRKDNPVPSKSNKVECDSSEKVIKKDDSKNLPSTGSPKVKNKKGGKSMRHTPHLVKPLVKTKNLVKRKTKKKMALDKTSRNKQCEFNNDLYMSSSSLVCQRCQCVVINEWEEVDQDSPVSPFASLSAEVSSGNVISDVTETIGDSKSSVSEERNLGRPSFCDRPHKSRDVRWEAIYHIRTQNGTIGLRNFNLVKKLGCGDIGTVYLAELIGTDCQFAIKVMDNEFLGRRNKMSRAQTEREILRMLDHPFLPTLYCRFTSDSLSCLVTEYCPGGDLHVLRQRQPGGCFAEHAARFYVAEVLLALEYLHMLGVIYRDLKPENILVREDGHIMLSDFDLSLRCTVNPMLLVSSSTSDRSKNMTTRPSVDSRCAHQPLCIEPSCQVTCFTPRLRKHKPDLASEVRPLLQLVVEPTSARSNSFVGTHEYLAPEIIKGEGHGSAVDWWTLGVFLYELLYGVTPFKGSGNDETMANVVLQTLKFPDCPLVSLHARDLIRALLVKEPENRLGTERGAADIKRHPFFDNLNWALIRCTVPPEMPKAGSLDKNGAYNSDSGEHLEFEGF